MNLRNYLFTYPSLLTSDEVEFINGKAAEFDLEEGAVGQGGRVGLDPDAEVINKRANGAGGKVVDNIRASDIRWLHGDHGKLLGDVWTRIEQAVTMGSKQSGWNVDIEYAEPLQHTTYHAQQGERGGFYTWHQDAGDVPYENNGMIRKLSMSIQLTDPDEYEGGNFQWIEDVRSKDTLTSKDYTRDMRDYYRQIPNSAKQKGSLLLFPSFVHHQVTPVTSGTRTSLVGWFCGHPYR
jgi:PKHD-type hydroxylase